ncbi:MAG: F0F1 ATP synthase subunit delta [Erysipelotrichaceae bacterium]|nr:F0F1 ATP synthase subunit delta [Erysipelotrichaceae bacterium]
MRMNSVTARYAEALFELAQEENKIDLWQQQMDLVQQVIEKNPQIIRILSHSKIEQEEKKSIIEQVFASLDRPVFNFLRLLVDKGRINYIQEISLAFHRMCNESKGIQEGVVYSAYPLDRSEVQMLEEAVSKKLNQKVELKTKLDDRLILGAKIVVDDKVIDGSLKNRMEMLRTSLLKESR